MLGAAIIVFGPIMITGIVGFVVAPVGLVWSPFAALITLRVARNRGLDGGRYALAGAISSIFLLLPWLLYWSLDYAKADSTPLHCSTYISSFIWSGCWGQSFGGHNLLHSLKSCRP